VKHSSNCQKQCRFLTWGPKCETFVKLPGMSLQVTLAISCSIIPCKGGSLQGKMEHEMAKATCKLTFAHGHCEYVRMPQTWSEGPGARHCGPPLRNRYQSHTHWNVVHTLWDGRVHGKCNGT